MSPPKSRLPWIDHLRTLMILLVVSMHACVTYSHVGDWYVTADKVPSLPEKLVFIFWQAHLQAFFMGLLFFVSGYFASGSLSRRGPREFLRERGVRLGLPVLFYMLVLHPFILIGLNPWHADFPPFWSYYAHYLGTGRFLGSSGPLWFAFALLIFCALLAASLRWQLAPANADSPPGDAAATPGAARLWMFGLLLGLATFLMRLVQPLGTNIMNFQLGYFPQYIAAFVVGVAAARSGWFLPLAASPQARRAGWLALIAGPLTLAGLLAALLETAATGDLAPHQGGWHWQSLALSVWEQLTGLGLSLGLLSFFSRRFNRDNPRLRWLADRSFGVYVLHAPVLVALMMGFRSLPQLPLLLAVLLTFTGLAISFALADLARRIPGLRAIL